MVEMSASEPSNELIDEKVIEMDSTCYEKATAAMCERWQELQWSVSAEIEESKESPNQWQLPFLFFPFFFSLPSSLLFSPSLIFSSRSLKSSVLFSLSVLLRLSLPH